MHPRSEVSPKWSGGYQVPWKEINCGGTVSREVFIRNWSGVVYLSWNYAYMGVRDREQEAFSTR
jgi:hypothetical protein